MRTTRLVLAGASTGALLAGLAFTAAPAEAAITPPTDCFSAQTTLTNAQHARALAQQADQQEDSTVSGSVDFTPDGPDTTLASATTDVGTAQGYVNALCGGVTGTPSPLPRPRFPRPIVFPTVPSCAQLAAIGQSNIPIGSQYYYPADDGNGNGIACESSAVNTTIPIGAIQVVQGRKCHWSGTAWIPIPAPAPTPAPITVINPPPAATVPNPCNCTVSAPAPAQTIIEQPPVIVPPAQTFTTPVMPSIGSVATGDGSLAAVLDPGPVDPDPITVKVTLDLGNVLNLVTLPRIPVL